LKKEGVIKINKLHEIDTILFDLDGTLLPIDLDEFLHKYFKVLTEELKDIFPPDELIANLMKATKKMINNNGLKSNKEVFFESFFKLFQCKNKIELLQRFDYFYRNKFPYLKYEFNIDIERGELLGLLHNHGYKLILATNPLFPRIAVEERLKWIGLQADYFELITTYENMHYSKPALNYYVEITDILGIEPERCMMVGNDLQEDMIAGKLGMKTLLIDDYLIESKIDEPLIPEWRGSFNEFERYIRENLIIKRERIK
jgi:FMN phosphatase YigB (HAD superfamily)